MSATILIAEHDSATRGLLTTWLEGAGYACVGTEPHDAIAQADRFQPSAILVRVEDAADAAMRVAERLATSPDPSAVIVVSSPNAEIAVAAARLGAIDCVPWPTSEQGIVETVDRAVRFREGRRVRQRCHARTREAIARAATTLRASVVGLAADAAQTLLITRMRQQSPETFAHAERVAAAAADLARAYHLSSGDVDRVERAAMLHDIGKVTIPNTLLESTSRLDDEQIAMLRMHVSIGAEILILVPGLGDVAAMVAAIHERFDGSGYPARLAGAEIPFGARLIAVADAYDAMTSLRPYRDPLTHDEANLELARVAGSQLDPDAVRVWIHMTESQPCL